MTEKVKGKPGGKCISIDENLDGIHGLLGGRANANVTESTSYLEINGSLTKANMWKVCKV